MVDEAGDHGGSKVNTQMFVNSYLGDEVSIMISATFFPLPNPVLKSTSIGMVSG